MSTDGIVLLLFAYLTKQRTIIATATVSVVALSLIKQVRGELP